MFIYKITDVDNGKSYIGADTKPKRHSSRWKRHLSNVKKSGFRKTKFYKALHKREDSFIYEILYEANTIGELFLKEIEYIERFDTFNNGYNSTLGGDCFKTLIRTTDEYQKLVEFFRTRQAEYNTTIKWFGTTTEDRKELTKHLHTEDVYKQKAITLKEYWKEVDKKERLKGLLDYITNNKENYQARAKFASDKALEKTRKKVSVLNLLTGEILSFPSCKDAKLNGVNVDYLIKKKKDGKIDKQWKIIDDSV